VVAQIIIQVEVRLLGEPDEAVGVKHGALDYVSRRTLQVEYF
jgi:hypothetical protein